MPHAEGDALVVPDIRDYQRINAELTRLLDSGSPRVRLVGVERQRLLAAGLAGAWKAVIEVEGNAGPELGAGLNAPGLTVLCRGDAADGVARSMKAGRVVVLGSATDAPGYDQRGGTLIIAGDAGHRAGLNCQGGSQLYRGRVGRLLGERQSGGVIYAPLGSVGPHSGRGRTGGDLVLFSTIDEIPAELIGLS
ncbi:glutamate synthase [Isosphaeraceae bacterium EP7]